MMSRVIETVSNAICDLQNRNLPSEDLQTILTSLSARDERGDGERWPYFIPNDGTPRTGYSVVNCSHSDQELNISEGFSIEASATKANAFAKPYYIDPERGRRRCKGLFALEEYSDRSSWKHDFVFVGYRGGYSRGDVGQFGSRNTREVFLQTLRREFVPTHLNVRVWLKTNDQFCFADPGMTAADREYKNQENRYIESLSESRFALCPRGGGNNSVRFFEALARCTVPVYVGDRTTKFPLDWIIDWDEVCFRIAWEEVLYGSYGERLEAILSLSTEDINRRRRYIFRIYHQFLASCRKEVFEQLVLLQAWTLLKNH